SSEGIDCSRCHGSGDTHVQKAHGRAPMAEVRAAIVNPARLPAERQMEVCMQCHLETTSFPFPHSVVRFGKTPFSFQPGQSLADSILFFDHPPAGPEPDRPQIVNATYRLRQSRCFLESGNNKLQCTT